MRELFLKYIDNQCSLAELEQLMTHFDNPANEQSLRELILQTLEDQGPVTSIQAVEDREEDYQSILNRIRNLSKAPVIPIRRRFLLRVAAAAVFVLLAGTAYFIISRPAKKAEIAATNRNMDVLAPEKNRAMITLADGSTVYLDEAGNGEIASQNNVRVVKLANGEVVYESADGSPLAQVEYNTLFNPRGSKPITLKLSDGTEVWLNSESSLRYPVVFIGHERNVEISGEAYFEVAKDASKKFTVSVPGQGRVEVLGTHFNINAYPEEELINTTLIEGSVKVYSQTQNSLVIKPGEQARLSGTGELSLNQNPDLEEVMAWKNGKFVFGESMDMESVMRQIARWYNLEVEFRGKITSHIGGSIQRDVPVSKVFQMLGETGDVSFRLEGRRVVVSPKN